MSRINKHFGPAVVKKPITAAQAGAPVDAGLSMELEKRILEDVKAGRVYTIKEVQSLLRVSYEKARQLCSKEPGILRAGDIRVPYCVFDNIVRRLVMRSSDHAA